MRDFYHDVHTGKAYVSVSINGVAWLVGHVDNFRRREALDAIQDRLVELSPEAHVVQFNSGKLPGLAVSRKAVTLRLGKNYYASPHANVDACVTYLSHKYASYHNLPEDGITRIVVQHVIRCAIRNYVLRNKRTPDLLE